MESQWVPQRGFPFEPVEFGGVRGKGFASLVLLPLRLLKAFWQSIQVVRRVKPDVVVGLGGYITFPGGMMSVLLGKPLVLHEQNSVAGMANRVLAGVADCIFSAFPHVLKKAVWVGNPLRQEFLNKPAPAERFAGRSGPLKLWVVGGSLGAQFLNARSNHNRSCRSGNLWAGLLRNPEPRLFLSGAQNFCDHLVCLVGRLAAVLDAIR
jgi:UDP-N-acetylglucosamine--N-acetylmuramyl-(pentapeptide) pyrophosphoryl-undecaprenol N-acetylglucosamine transferase